VTDLDDLVSEGLGAPESPPDIPDTEPEWTGHPMDKPGVWVCDEVVDGAPCGKTFKTRRALSGHTSLAHRQGGNPRTTGKDRPPSRKPAQSKKATGQAAKAAAPPQPDGYRVSMYSTSITAAALVAHLVAGQYFDATDLDIVTKGSPGLATALDAVGDKHEAVRQACDAILGGATGAVYIQLLIAASAIVVPIAAHHGLLPPSTGERFAAITGAMVPPPTPPAGEGPVSAPSGPPASDGATPPTVT
jgi:hypothetical protein